MKNFMTIEDEVREQICDRKDDSKEVIISGKNLKGMDLSNCAIENVKFRDCKLNDADFSGTSLSTVKFESCDMENADFSSASLDGCHIIETSLKGVDFSDAIIEMSVITMSDFTNTNFNRCSIVFNTISDCDFCNSSIKSIYDFTDGENEIDNCRDDYHIEKIQEAIVAKDFVTGYKYAKEMYALDAPFEFMKNVVEIHGANNQILEDAAKSVQQYDKETDDFRKTLINNVVDDAKQVEDEKKATATHADNRPITDIYEYEKVFFQGRESAQREVFSNLIKSTLMQGHGKIGSEKAINQSIKIAKIILPHWDDKEIKENLNHVLNKMQITLNEKREGNNLQR